MNATDEPTVAITGAAGYIGSCIVDQFNTAHPEWELVAVDNQFRGQVDSVGDLPIRHVDVRDRRRLEEVLAGADVVVHLAALSGVDDCESNRGLAYEVNVRGTNNVAWFCHRTGAGMVFPFSMASIGDPKSFPITADHPREPLNWYGRTKEIGESSVESLSVDSFPAICFMKSNLYGSHEVDGTTISKQTVINFFVDRAIANEPLTVYEPGTQARNFVHVKDVANAYVRATERLVARADRGETGTETYEIASDEAHSVMAVAESVRDTAYRELGIDVNVERVENPRQNETTVEEFDVDISRTRRVLDWNPDRSVEETVRTLLTDQA